MNLRNQPIVCIDVKIICAISIRPMDAGRPVDFNQPFVIGICAHIQPGFGIILEKDIVPDPNIRLKRCIGDGPGHVTRNILFIRISPVYSVRQIQTVLFQGGSDLINQEAQRILAAIRIIRQIFRPIEAAFRLFLSLKKAVTLFFSAQQVLQSRMSLCSGSFRYSSVVSSMIGQYLGLIVSQ